MKKLLVEFVSPMNNAQVHCLGNVLVRIRVTFLPDCSLVLSLLKHRDVGTFMN